MLKSEWDKRRFRNRLPGLQQCGQFSHDQCPFRPIYQHLLNFVDNSLVFKLAAGNNMWTMWFPEPVPRSSNVLTLSMITPCNMYIEICRILRQICQWPCQMLNTGLATRQFKNRFPRHLNCGELSHFVEPSRVANQNSENVIEISSVITPVTTYNIVQQVSRNLSRAHGRMVESRLFCYHSV